MLKDKISSVLILGGGYEGVIAELLKLPIDKIDYVEINESIIKTIINYLPKNLKSSLENKRLNIIYNDPRKFLQRELNLYDVILVGMPEPMSAQNNRFYTKEFFSQCSKFLRKNGIISFKINSSENLWTAQLTERNRGIYNALNSTFGNTIVLPGTINIFIASESKLVADTKVLVNRFKERRVETKLVSPRYIDYIFTNDRFEEIQKLLSNGKHIINSDFHPVCYGYTTSIWLSKFFPSLAYSENSFQHIFESPGSFHYIIISIFILLIIFASRKFNTLKRFILVFFSGFAGMILEIVLIILYQNKNGVLYRDIGFLLTVFMMGLTIGAFVVYKLFALSKSRQIHLKATGIIIFAGFFVLNVLVYFVMRYDLINGIILISAGLFFTGLFVAGIFSFVSLDKTPDQQKVISQLYAADLIGGSLGSLTAGLILIPFYGLPISVALTTILTALCLIIIY